MAGATGLSTGVVKKWNEEKGFGFLLPQAGGLDVFVHHKALLEGRRSLAVGDKVTFVAEDDGKGRGKFKAANVKVISSGGSLFEDVLPADESEVEASCDAPCPVGRFLEVAAESDPEAAELVEAFLARSSLGCPFLVLSESQLVADVRCPTPAEFHRLRALTLAYVAGCEACKAVLLVDFEGEMPGHGGVLTVAQLQFSSGLDAATLVPHSRPAGPPRTLGLLIDLRTESCISVLRRIMESPEILKLSWGADGDCQSLVHQAAPVPLSVQPTAVVDMRFGFDNLGMGAMIQHVPSHMLTGLPDKEQIDFDAFHSKNREALALPLQMRDAAYAMDDLHRIEAILCSKMPVGGSYLESRRKSDRMLEEVRADPKGLQALKQQTDWFERRRGVKRLVKAVEIMRHILSLRLRGVELLEGQERDQVEYSEICALEELESAGVVIPEDLSFASPVEHSSASSDPEA